MGKLDNRKVAVLVTNGFEEIEFTEPIDQLKNEGAEVHVVSPEDDTVKSWNKKNWGKEFDVDVPLSEASPENYDSLLLPGGVMSPDKLRMNSKAVAFVKHFMEKGKPVAAICHGPWTLIETGLIKGRKMTSYPSLKSDLKNAGAEWVDEEVVTDNGLVTSRKPDDLDAFCSKMVEEFREGKHEPARSKQR